MQHTIAQTNARIPAEHRLLVAAAIGAAVSISIGVYGRVHTPTGGAITDFGFGSVIEMKAWLATATAVLAMAQLVSALWMWGRLPISMPAPTWTGTAHRWTGTAAFLVSLPVAYHCLWALGFQTADARVIAHSLFGAAFYGALTTKLIALRIDGLPRWAIPVLGGSLVVLLTAIWLTSSLWFFTTVA